MEKINIILYRIEIDVLENWSFHLILPLKKYYVNHDAYVKVLAKVFLLDVYIRVAMVYAVIFTTLPGFYMETRRRINNDLSLVETHIIIIILHKMATSA